MEERVRQSIADGVAFASNSPFPDVSELTTDVYA
jgi:TPP-dependent pyruvate/acetoin dehydrogenase alpha subunit